MQGFGVHAVVPCGGDQRSLEMEQSCRYSICLALANERVQCNTARQVMLEQKTPGHHAPRDFAAGVHAAAR